VHEANQEAMPYVQAAQEQELSPFCLDAINLSNDLGSRCLYQEAARVLQLFIDHDSSHPIAYYNQAHWFSMQADFSAAVNAYQASLQLQPLNPCTWGSLGYALARLGRHLEAIHAYSQSLQQHPTEGAIFYLRSVSLFLADDAKAALADLDSALSLKAIPQLSLIQSILDTDQERTRNP
jgi:tetratricopeptide (TPR) repeat protein